MDLRREIFRMFGEGKRNDEIISYLVDRYGDFVLYRPPLNSSTALLWFGPGVLLVGGLLVLLLFGGMGIVGSMCFSAFGLRFPRSFLLLALAVLTASLWLLLPSTAWLPGLYLVCAIWGVAMLCMALALQAKVLRLASDATDVGMSLFSGLFNVGIGAGALLGSQVGTHAGLQHLGAVGGSLAVLGLLWCAYATWKWAGSFHPAPQR